MVQNELIELVDRTSMNKRRKNDGVVKGTNKCTGGEKKNCREIAYELFCPVQFSGGIYAFKAK